MAPNTSSAPENFREEVSFVDNRILLLEIEAMNGKLELQHSLTEKLVQIVNNLAHRVNEIERQNCLMRRNITYASVSSSMTKRDYTPRNFETNNIISIPLGTSSRGSPMRKWMSTSEISANKPNSSAFSSKVHKSSRVSSSK